MIISLDWLSLSVHGDLSQLPFDFEIEATDARNRIFTKVTKLLYKGREVALIQHDPASSLLDKRLMVVKFDNALLYDTQDPIIFANFVLNSWRWKFNNVNRIDVCCDFQSMNNGLSPQAFIANLMSGEWHRKGERKVVYHGRDQNSIDRVYTTKGKNLVAYFNKESNYLASQVTGYRSGSRASSVCVYLYNKTLELKTETDKPYIRSIWRQFGYSTLFDTWRLEISLKGKSFADLNLSDFTREKIVSTFANLYNEYFQIYTIEGGTTTRIYPLDLRSVQQTNYKLSQKERKKGGDKSSRLFLSRLITELHAQHINNASNNGALIDLLSLTIYEFATQKCLERYAVEKLIYAKLYEEAKMFQKVGEEEGWMRKNLTGARC